MVNITKELSLHCGISIDSIKTYLYRRYSEGLINIISVEKESDKIKFKLSSELINESSLSYLWDFTIDSITEKTDIKIS